MLTIALPWVLAHFIGDFLLQNDYQAINKKKSSLVCFSHVLWYCVPFVLTTATPFMIFLIFVQHFIQDRWGFIKWYCHRFGVFQGELKQSVLPWGHFIVDQIFHIIWLWLVFQFVPIIFA